jgi:hypothetical protein
MISRNICVLLAMAAAVAAVPVPDSMFFVIQMFPNNLVNFPRTARDAANAHISVPEMRDCRPALIEPAEIPSPKSLLTYLGATLAQLWRRDNMTSVSLGIPPTSHYVTRTPTSRRHQMYTIDSRSTSNYLAPLRYDIYSIRFSWNWHTYCNRLCAARYISIRL